VTDRDPRLTLARPDLASAALEGLVAADRHAPTTTRQCAAPAAAIRAAPTDASEQADQLLFGERFDVLETKAGWAWGQAWRDGYVGYVREAMLAEPVGAPTHRVSALRAYGFAEPALRAPAVGPISINALVRIEDRDGRFVRAAGLGWMVEAQLAPVGVFETDFVAVAERFVGAAYLWGGREAHGLDCSGLVQQALFACGRSCPRDTDQQQALGQPAPPDALRRGDLVFWPGHVAIVAGAGAVAHASGHRAAVVIEPLADVVRRNQLAGGGAPIAYRRL
jgi:cell wall-associated NlpC family hydrolase